MGVQELLETFYINFVLRNSRHGCHVAQCEVIITIYKEKLKVKKMNNGRRENTKDWKVFVPRAFLRDKDDCEGLVLFWPCGPFINGCNGHAMYDLGMRFDPLA